MITDEELARLKRQAAQQVASDSSGGRETHFSGADSIALIAEVERLKAELAIAWEDDELAAEVAAHEKTKAELAEARGQSVELFTAGPKREPGCFCNTLDCEHQCP